MADQPTCARCQSPCPKGTALCGPCRRELEEKAAEAERKRRVE